MKRFVLIYNPISGHAALRQKLDYMIDAVLSRGAMVIPYRTRLNDTGMADFLREAAPDGVIAAGGDGTLREVAGVLLREKLDLPLGLIGSGTSNDFVSHLGVNRDMEAYFDRIVAGETAFCDIGLANGRYFVNVASAGVLTSVAHEVNVQFKHALGKAAYYLRGIGEIPRFHTLGLHIEADGKSYDERAYFFVICNSTVAGGIKNAAPLASIDDGRLDFVAVKDCSMAEFLSLAAAVAAGTVRPDDRHILYLQAAHIRVSADEEAESDLDGERGPMLPLDVSVIPRALRLFA
ncbi:MAG: YegS/Rv2252/BmrU family lipid kinase [Schwartzia sp.]|nr:YegS/Rv2252/BmrU family lipid kinase [Schwartzia sp. (in: firmicutes)]